MKRLLAVILATVMCLSLAACGSSKTEAKKDYSKWPEQDVVIYVNSKAGSSGDSVARQVSLALENSPKMNGHKMIVNNIIDGNGTESWTPVKNADENGYAMGMMSTVIVTANLLGNSDLTLDDFDYLCGFFVDPQWVTVPYDAPYNTFDELIQYIKENPGKINWGTANATSSDSIALAAFCKNNPDVQFNRITYNGGGEMLTALLGGFVDVTICEYLDIAANIEGKTLKTIGVMSEERIKGHEDVPTLKEAGYDMVLERARGMSIPKNTAPEVKEKLVDLMKDAFNSDNFQEWMTVNGTDIRWMTGDEFKKSYEDHKAVMEVGIAELMK